jgi:hypothetical protein
MSYLARGPALAGIDSKANATGGRHRSTFHAVEGSEAAI